MILVKKAFKVFSTVFFIYAMTVCFQSVWLKPFASVLIVQDSYVSEDLIVVSTGSYERFLFAAKLFKENPNSHMLILGDRRLETPLPGKSPLDIAKMETIVLGLQEDKLEFRHSTSTLVDARQAKNLMEEKGFKSASVISDPYNMRRLGIIFEYVFKDSNFVLRFAHGQERWKPDKWWMEEEDFKFVFKEWIKFPIDFVRIRLLG
jgi:uncharacterized SAM-binding protein YcdF (DUF218 family)